MQNLVIPPHMTGLIYELFNKDCTRVVPEGWKCYIVLCHDTNQYYSGISNNYGQLATYLKAAKENLGFNKLAISLSKLIRASNNYQVFAISITARAAVENWLGYSGRIRIATKRGESGMSAILYQIHSLRLNLDWFVSGKVNADKEELIAIANKNILRWLATKGYVYASDKLSMRSATKSTITNTGVVFEPESIVTPTSYYQNMKPSEYSSTTRIHNVQAVKDFIRNT